MGTIATGQISLVDLSDAIIAGDPPTNPVTGQLWIDDSIDPNILKIWNGSKWEEQNLSIKNLDPNFHSVVDKLKNFTDSAANDGVVTSSEKTYIKLILVELTGSTLSTGVIPNISEIEEIRGGEVYKALAGSRAAGVGEDNPEYVNFKESYNNLSNYLNSLSPSILEKGDTEIEPVEWSDKWNMYYKTLSRLETTTAGYLANSIKPGESYNGVKIDDVNGIVILRGDELFEVVLNATEGLSINQKEDDGSWSKAFYTDTDGKVYATSLVIGSKALINGMLAEDLINSTVSTKESVEDMTTDMKISPLEKTILKRDWESIQSEYAELYQEAQETSVDSTLLEESFNELNNSPPRIEAEILGSLSSTYTFSSEASRNIFNQKIKRYYHEAEKMRISLGKKILSDAKEDATEKAEATKRDVIEVTDSKFEAMDEKITGRIQKTETDFNDFKTGDYKTFKDQYGEFKLEVDNFTTKIGNVENIEGTLVDSFSEFKQEVGLIESTVRDVRVELDELEIGGRNLIPSFRSEKWMWRNTPPEEINDYELILPSGRNVSFYINVPVQPNQDYTFTFNTDYARYYIHRVVNGERVGIIRTLTGSDVFTFNSEDLEEIEISIDTFSGNLEYERRVYNLKLEKGNKATDWSPAPEDMDARMTAAQSAISQLSDEIELRVTKEEFENLEIGGRNLIYDTGKIKESELWEFVNVNDDHLNGNAFNFKESGDSYFKYSYNNSSIEVRKDYIMSFGMSLGSNKEIEVWAEHTYNWYNPDKGVSEVLTDVLFHYVVDSSYYNEKTKRYVLPVNFDFKSNGTFLYIGYKGTNIQSSKRLATYLNTASITNYNTFRPKVESGSKATDWSPAPEDTQSQIDEATERITKAETNITLNSEAIELKAEKSELINYVDKKVYNDKIGELTTSIDNITGRVESTEVDFNDFKTGDFNTFKQQYGEFKLEMDNFTTKIGELSDIDGTLVDNFSKVKQEVGLIESTVRDVKTDLDNLEIGGRNLITLNSVTRSHATVNDYKYTLTKTSSSGNPYIRIPHTLFENDTEYVITFKAKKVSGNVYRLAGHSTLAVHSSVRLFIDGVEQTDKLSLGWSNVGTANYPNDNEVHQYEIRFKTVSDVASLSTPYWYIQPNRPQYNSDSFVLEIWDWQLEKGNKATDWSPAPEDMDNKIDGVANDLNLLTSRVQSAEQKITPSAITSTVTSSSSWINLNNTVNSKASQSSLNSLVTRVNTAEQKITNSAIVSTVRSSTSYQNDLNSKLNSNDFTGTEIVSKIEQTASSIKLSASKIDFDGHVFGSNATFTGDIKGATLESVVGSDSIKIDSGSIIASRGINEFFRISNGVLKLTGSVNGIPNFVEGISFVGYKEKNIITSRAIEGYDSYPESSYFQKPLTLMADTTQGTGIRFMSKEYNENPLLRAEMLQNGGFVFYQGVETRGGIKAGNIAVGSVSVPGGSGKRTTVDVKFGKTFPKSPQVAIAPNTTVMGSTVSGVGVGRVTTTGFSVNVLRSNTTNTIIRWIAISD